MHTCNKYTRTRTCTHARRFNRLLEVIRTSLQSMDLSLKGLQVMSADLEAAHRSISLNQVRYAFQVAHKSISLNQVDFSEFEPGTTQTNQFEPGRRW